MRTVAAMHQTGADIADYEPEPIPRDAHRGKKLLGTRRRNPIIAPNLKYHSTRILQIAVPADSGARSLYRLTTAPRYERRELFCIAIAPGRALIASRCRRMGVNLRAAARELGEETCDSLLRHGAGPGESEHAIRCDQSRVLYPPQHHCTPGRRDDRDRASRRALDGTQKRHRLDRRPPGAHAAIAADSENLGGHRWMLVVIAMGVDIVERKPSRPVGLELRPDLGSKLAANGGPDHNREAVSHDIIAQASV